MTRPAGRFALVLHTHIPYVLRHGRWPHGTDWLCEAVAESYLPILAALDALAKDKVAARVTISLSPILCEQLADDSFRDEFERWIRARRDTYARDLREAEQSGDGALASLARLWQVWIDEVEKRFNACDGKILAGFRRLEEQGLVELATCAATHAYLPLLSREGSVQLQLRAAVAAHQRHFGRAPRGVWLPECAYRPRYEWTPPFGRESGKARWLRPGLEERVSEAGLEWFVVDAHLAAAGEPLSIYRNFYPPLASLRGFEDRFPQLPRKRSSAQPILVKSPGGERTAVAFLRDARTSLQVWSRDEGYPGDGAYLDFHRRKIANGPRYHRVTGPGVVDANKALYDPAAAQARAEENARHFVWLVGDTLERAHAAGVPEPFVCSPFDTELFGHWWFEGPLFLEHVFRHLATAGITAVSATDQLSQPRPRDVVSLLEGSWGEGGDHRAWLNAETGWTWDRLYDAEADVDRCAKEAKRDLATGAHDDPIHRAMRQALRELMLLQSSDWQFNITTGAAREYAERRFATHYVELKRLVDVVRRVLGGAGSLEEDGAYLELMEKRDGAFPDLDISWFTDPN